MIHDSILNRSAYRGLSHRFALALDSLPRFAAETPDGRIPLEGDDVFALVQSYRTSPAADRLFESHRIYADVQLMIAGQEMIEVESIERLNIRTAYTASNDSALYVGSTDMRLFLGPGDFAIFLPQDGHKPGCQHHLPGHVKKVVVKVRL